MSAGMAHLKGLAGTGGSTSEVAHMAISECWLLGVGSGPFHAGLSVGTFPWGCLRHLLTWTLVYPGKALLLIASHTAHLILTRSLQDS
jgi:hypothetical protein